MRLKSLIRWMASKYTMRIGRLAKKHNTRVSRIFILFCVLLVAFATLILLFHDTHDVESLVPIGSVKSSRVTGGGAHKTDEMMYRPDGRGGTVRVVVLMLSTKMTDFTCDALASAFFTDIPVIVFGHDQPYPNNIIKPSYFLEAIEAADLNDEDVVLPIDNDLIFVSQDVLTYIDRFIALSPRSPEELNVSAIRKGHAMAPSIYTIEEKAYLAEVAELFPQEVAEITMNQLADSTANYSAKYGGAYYIPKPPKSHYHLRHINSGTSIHRAWAFRELMTAMLNFAKVEKSVIPGHPHISDDQGSMQGLYYHLIRWEVENDALGNASIHLGRSKHGLRAGVLELDHNNELCLVMMYFLRKAPHYTLNPKLWGLQFANHTGYQYMHAHKWLERAFRNILKRANWEVPVEQRGISSFGTSMALYYSPPLLAVAPSMVGEHYRRKETVYTIIIHGAGKHKVKCMDEMLYSMSWFIPMKYSKTRWDAGREYLESMYVTRWNWTMKRRDRYVDLCPNHILHEEFRTPV